MAEPKFTPGPWQYGQRDYVDDTFEEIVKPLPINHKARDYGDGASIFGADGEEVAGNTEYQVFYKPEDVALMLAAPDMYKALEEIYKTFKDRSYSQPRNNNTCGGVTFTYGDMKEVIRALRKARGEE